MPATRVNYIVLFDTDSQVYGTSNKERALEHAPPPGGTLDDKHVFFITYQPDNRILAVHEVPREEIDNAVIKQPKTGKKSDDEQEA